MRRAAHKVFIPDVMVVPAGARASLPARQTRHAGHLLPIRSRSWSRSGQSSTGRLRYPMPSFPSTSSAATWRSGSSTPMTEDPDKLGETTGWVVSGDHVPRRRRFARGRHAGGRDRPGAALRRLIRDGRAAAVAVTALPPYLSGKWTSQFRAFMARQRGPRGVRSWWGTPPSFPYSERRPPVALRLNTSQNGCEPSNQRV